ncbi:hypothetical protein JCM10212_001667 [Sporobolomyces blumeae]
METTTAASPSSLFPHLPTCPTRSSLVLLRPRLARDSDIDRDSKSLLSIIVLHFDLALSSLSSAVYVGDLSLFTTEEQIYELFSRAGEIKRIILDLACNPKTPRGLFFHHNHALAFRRYISGTKLDKRIIRADLDPSTARTRTRDWDAGRGGWGHLKTRQEMEDVEQSWQRKQDELYRDDHEGGRWPDVPMGDRVQDDGFV